MDRLIQRHMAAAQSAYEGKPGGLDAVRAYAALHEIGEEGWCTGCETIVPTLADTCMACATPTLNPNDSVIALRGMGRLVAIWEPADIQSIRPDWTLERCAAALHRIRKHFDERLTEIGWQVMDDLLSMETL